MPLGSTSIVEISYHMIDWYISYMSKCLEFVYMNQLGVLTRVVRRSPWVYKDNKPSGLFAQTACVVDFHLSGEIVKFRHETCTSYSNTHKISLIFSLMPQTGKKDFCQEAHLLWTGTLIFAAMICQRGTVNVWLSLSFLNYIPESMRLIHMRSKCPLTKFEKKKKKKCLPHHSWHLPQPYSPS